MADKKKKDERYPRTLYKAGGPKKWGKGHMYSDVIVENEEDQAAAEKAGYIDSFQDDLFPPAEEKGIADMTKDQIMEALDGLEIDYDPRAKKDVLVGLLEEANASEEGNE